MNSAYSGNCIDQFKYDLLIHLTGGSKRHGLFYVPMLTEPRPKERNQKYETYEVGAMNKPLLKLMKREYEKDYSDIDVAKKFLTKSGVHLSMLNFGTGKRTEYFSDDNRKEYFQSALIHYKSLVNPTLVYLDPDVGSDIGVTRRFRSNKHMYIRKHELLSFQQAMKKSDSLMFFQHLGNSLYTLPARIKDLVSTFGDLVLFMAYSRTQTGFILLFNDEATCRDMRLLIEQYYHRHEHLKHFDKLTINAKPLKSSGFLL